MEIVENNLRKRNELFRIEICEQCHSVLKVSGKDLEVEDEPEWHYFFLCPACGHYNKKPPEYGELGYWKSEEHWENVVRENVLKAQFQAGLYFNSILQEGKSGDTNEKGFNRNESEKES